MKGKKIRVVLAMVGFDSHDRGLRLVASAIRDAGMEVIYAGSFQTEESLYSTVIQEDAAVVGLSFLCGGHLGWMERVIRFFKDHGENTQTFIVGGIIPKEDIPKLKNLGVKEVFGSGTDLNEIINTMKRIAQGS